MNYNSWYKAKLLIAGFLLFICANQLFPQEVDEENDITREYFIEPGLEYYSPSHWNRQIKTININVLIGKECIEMIGLQVFAGATITHAWGNTIMVNELLKETQYKTSAMGIGPIILFRLQPINVGSFSASVDALAGIILYNKPFPPRGDIYNFMFRLGGTITFYINENYSLNIGLRRMHVSNGQGVGSFNPFYEGTGLSFNLIRKI